ncbi:MAG: transcriptional regulator [Rhodothermales bacterium]|nr:transcriptional regulator [Rhodothermales bacterium]
MRIAHISDIHFGRISADGIVDALVEEINDSDVDLVVASGDLTQRARRWQLRSAKKMLDSFSPPVVVVPGNHDAYAWWYPFHRLAVPVRRYRKYISDDLSPVVEMPDLALLGISSVHGWTIKSGLVRKRDRQHIEEFFKRDDTRFKILVVHHHLVGMPEFGRHDVSLFGRNAFSLISDAGVNLVLSGHLHRSHVEVFERADAAPLVVASAGTATSDRGRPRVHYENHYNMIDVDKASFQIEERRFVASIRQYERERISTHPRNAS